MGYLKLVGDSKVRYIVTVDEKGRITIPREIREQVNAKIFELDVENNIIMLKPTTLG